MAATTPAWTSANGSRPYVQGRRTSRMWNESPLASIVREPREGRYGERGRRAQLEFRIILLQGALTQHPEDRDRLLEQAGRDPFFQNLNGYEQRLVIRALDLSRAEAQALFL